MNEILQSLTEGFFDLIYPSNIYCIRCGNIIDDSRPYALCDVCVRTLKWVGERTCLRCGKILQENYLHELCTDCRDMEHRYTRGFTCVEYGSAERELLHRFKYKDKSYLGRKLAEIMYDRIQAEDLDPDILLPVPMYRRKEKTRGYNQAVILAKSLAELMGKPYDGKLLLRIADTKAMSRLSAGERRRNIQRAFIVSTRKSAILKNKRVLLLDDIYTTGSTADACAEALIEAGASEIFVFTFASGVNIQKDLVESNHNK